MLRSLSLEHVFFVGVATTHETLALYQRVASGEIDLHVPLQCCRALR